MKRYNRFDHHMILLGIIVPFLVFFISMNAAFAYFTATASKSEAETETALIKINFTADTVGEVYNTTQTKQTKVLPGDTLKINSTLQNSGTADCYVVLEYELKITKQNSDYTETLAKEYYTLTATSNNWEKVSGIPGNYNQTPAAFSYKSGLNSKSKLFEYPFDFEEYDNSYKNATVSYSLTAHAIQTAHISTTQAMDMLMENIGYNSSKIYGNSYQAVGTGKNLFNDRETVLEIYQTQLTQSPNKIRATFIGTDASTYANNKIKVADIAPGTTVTLSGKWECNHNQGRVMLAYYNGSTTPILTLTESGGSVTGSIPAKPSAGHQLCILIYSKLGNSLPANEEVIYSDIQLEKGSAATAYEPYCGGEPSPTLTNPAEIQSVGDRTKNLFNTKVTATGDAGVSANTTIRPLKENIWYLGLTWNNYNDNTRLLHYSLNGDSISLESKAGYGISQAFKCKPNTTYSLSYKRDTTEFSGVARCGYYKANGEFINFNSSPTFTTPENAAILTVCFQSEGGITTFSQIQLEEGSTSTAYEPYGYKIPVNVSGKNLLNIHGRSEGLITSSGSSTADRTFDFGSYYIGLTRNNYYYPNNTAYASVNGNSATILVYYGGYGIAFPIKAQPNTTYTLSRGVGGSMGIGFYTVDGKYLQCSNEITSFPHTFETPSNCGIITIILSPKTDIETTYENVQLELGSTATDYNLGSGTFNIYLDEPLRRIGDVADYIDLETGEVVRRIRSLELNVSDMNNSDPYPGWRNISIVGDDLGWNKDDTILKLAYNGLFMNNISSTISFSLNSKNSSADVYTTTSAFGLNQTQLKEQFPNLVINICYALFNPDIETIEPLGINFNLGYTVTVGTSIPPSYNVI